MPITEQWSLLAVQDPLSPMPQARTYDIRHTHASLLIDDGANVLAVAQRMGHTDPGVTPRVYGHLFEGVQEELTERLDLRRRAATRVGSPPQAPVVELHRRDAHGR